jgi:hypothetical protein
MDKPERLRRFVGDRLVVCAVIREPVSTANSLLTGKLTGNFTVLRFAGPSLQPEAAVPQRLFGQFPKKNNREKFSNNRDRNPTNRLFLTRYQGQLVFHRAWDMLIAKEARLSPSLK